MAAWSLGEWLDRIRPAAGERISRKILLPIFALLFLLGLAGGIAVAAWLTQVTTAAPRPVLGTIPLDATPRPVPQRRVAAVPANPVALRSVRPRYVPVADVGTGTAKRSSDRPIIAVVIDDLGVQRHRTSAAMELPAPINLAFFPHSPELRSQVARARRQGHSILLHMPMAPREPNDAVGPKPLRTSLSPEANRSRLTAALEAVGNPGPIAVNNHMGSGFTADRSGMRRVLELLARRDTIFLDSLTAPDSQARKLAPRVGATVVARDVFLDHRRSPSAIRAALAETEKIAREYGSAIAIGHPYPETRRALAGWLPSLEDKGIRQVKLQQVVARRARVGEEPIASAAIPAEGS